MILKLLFLAVYCQIVAVTTSMTWNQICQTYPDEWVVVVNYEKKGAVEVDGVVVVHGHQRSSLVGLVSKAMRQYGQAAVRYTGELIQESELPLLWQIYPIDSIKS